MKVHILVTVVAALAFASLVGCRDKEPAVSSGAQKPLILSPEVGKQLEGIIRSETVKAAVPRGWTIESVQVAARSIILKLTGPGGASAVLEMRSKEAGGAEKGRWFSYDVPADPAGLGALAKALDAGFSASPWSEPKREGVPPHPGEAPASPAPGPGSPGPAPSGEPSVPSPASPPAAPPPAAPAGTGEPSPAAAPAPATPPPPAPQSDRMGAPKAPLTSDAFAASGGFTPHAAAPAARSQPCFQSGRSQSRPSPTPAWPVLASASIQVCALIGVVGHALRDAWRS